PGPLNANVTIDYASGIEQGLQHLLALKHRHIAFITGPLQLFSSRARQSAFISGLKTEGISAKREMIVHADHKVEGGIRAMRGLLELSPRPTAVMTSNDLMAIGALSAIHQAGLRVPEDISVIGFDDIAFASVTQPALTTVALSREQLAITVLTAMNHLIERE